MTFFRILFTLLLVVPMAVFMIYLLNKMIDDLNTSVKNSMTEKKTDYRETYCDVRAVRRIPYRGAQRSRQFLWYG